MNLQVKSPPASIHVPVEKRTMQNVNPQVKTPPDGSSNEELSTDGYKLCPPSKEPSTDSLPGLLSDTAESAQDACETAESARSTTGCCPPWRRTFKPKASAKGFKQVTKPREKPWMRFDPTKRNYHRKMLRAEKDYYEAVVNNDESFKAVPKDATIGPLRHDVLRCS